MKIHQLLYLLQSLAGGEITATVWRRFALQEMPFKLKRARTFRDSAYMFYDFYQKCPRARWFVPLSVFCHVLKPPHGSRNQTYFCGFACFLGFAWFSWLPRKPKNMNNQKTWRPGVSVLFLTKHCYLPSRHASRPVSNNDGREQKLVRERPLREQELVPAASERLGCLVSNNAW